MVDVIICWKFRANANYKSMFDLERNICGKRGSESGRPYLANKMWNQLWHLIINSNAEGFHYFWVEHSWSQSAVQMWQGKGSMLQRQQQNWGENINKDLRTNLCSQSQLVLFVFCTCPHEGMNIWGTKTLLVNFVFKKQLSTSLRLCFVMLQGITGTPVSGRWTTSA